MYSLFGLGNPGNHYRHTPHNIGLEVCVGLIHYWSGVKRYGGRAGLFTVYNCGEELEIVLAGTYMNHSGQAVSAWLEGQPEKLKQLVLVHDDLDLPLGEWKISAGKGSGGHRGVESIQRVFPEENFLRFRLGVAPVDDSGRLRKPGGREAVSNYLLSPYSRAAGEKLLGLVPSVAKAAQSLVEWGAEYTISRYNQVEGPLARDS